MGVAYETDLEGQVRRLEEREQKLILENADLRHEKRLLTECFMEVTEVARHSVRANAGVEEFDAVEAERVLTGVAGKLFGLSLRKVVP